MNQFGKKLIEWQEINVSDDDQNLVLQLHFDNVELLHKIIHDKWYGMWNKLRKRNVELSF